MLPAPEPLSALRRALGPWRALLLVTLLLAAQAAGLAHRVAHGPQAPAGAAHTAHWGHAAPSGHGHAEPSAGEATGHEAGTEVSAECRLYDQLLGHADGLFGAAVVDALLPAPTALPLPQRPSHRLSPAAAFQARAPPLA